MVLIFLATYLLIIGAGSFITTGSLTSIVTLWQKAFFIRQFSFLQQ